MRWLFVLLIACGGSTETPSPAPSAPSAIAAKCTGSAARKPGQHDVLLLTIDTLRADRLGYAGHAAASTPNLDALAQRGQAFLQATTPLPRTTPALASMLTGLQPHHHGAREVGDKITVKRTIATQLQAHGWKTIGVSAMKVAGPDQGLDAGFMKFTVEHDARAMDLTKTALELAGEVDESCPLMLWIHFADPHFPYLPPKGAPQPDGATCRTLGEKAAKGKVRRYKLFSDMGGMASRALEDCKALYDAEIAYTDTAVGSLMDGLRTLGRTDPLTVFTADHGENMGEWGLFYEHGPNVHDASLNIPMVMAGPGIPSGRSLQVARLEDVRPTLQAMLKVDDPSETTDGADLSKRWRAQELGPQIALAESGSALHTRLTDYLVTGRKSRMHCINGERFSLCRTSKGRETLYDRNSDPHLRKDVLKTHPEQASGLRTAWKDWPVERTRQRVARTTRFSLVARPQLSGGYDKALYDHRADPGLLNDVSSIHPAEFKRLDDALTTWAAQLDDKPTEIEERSLETEEAMRSLGYIE